MMKSLRFLTLALLGAFAIAACDEGTDTTATAVEGTVRGTVTIEGSGASGVTVTLSSGASVTTDGSGAYTFNNVPAGTYVVEISGFPSDATFASTAKTAVVTTAGQVVTVDFSGSFVRTSSVVGNVSVAGVGPLAGVTVSLSGAATGSTTTDAAGQYAFTGLRAGAYTVAISGFDAVQYTFSPTSKNATVGAGATEVVSFSGSQVATAKISGAMFLDENDKNNVYDGAALEAFLMAANVAITLKGPNVGNSQTVQTDANGQFMFTDLVAGTYSVGINPADPDIPSYVAFGGDTTNVVVTLTPGQMATAYFPFDIVQQMVNVCVFTGTDGVSPGHYGVPGGRITLYPRKLDADNSTNAFATQTTDATGCTEFSFARASDTSPQPGLADHIVFATINGTPPGNYFLNGENRIEIGYDTRFAHSEAPDTFDVLATRVKLAFDGEEIDADPLAGWLWAAWTDTTVAAVGAGTLNSMGDGMFTSNTGGIAGLPRTIRIRLQGGQPLANGHAFSQTPDPDAPGTAQGQYLTFVQQGFNLDNDTVSIGTEIIKYLDADINVKVFHETDDSLGTPMFTAGDNLINVDQIDVTLWDLDAGSAVATVGAGAGTGDVTFANRSTSTNWAVSAHPRPALPFNKYVLDDTVQVVVGMDGSDQEADQCQQQGSAGCATFSYKYVNGTIQGTVRAADGTDANGVRVVISPNPMNIQPAVSHGTTIGDFHSIVDTTLFVSGGSYFLGGVGEGPWDVKVIDSVGVWEFFVKNGTNATPHDCKGDLQGNANNIPCSFTATRMDTKVLGVIVNDRDFDGTTIDPNEALAGVMLDLYRTKVDPDSLVGSTTSSGNGSYAFTNLREGTYVVKAAAGPTSAAVVTQGIQPNGLPFDTQVVKTAATTTGLGGQNTRQVGDTVVGTIPGLPVYPYWNYGAANVAGDDPSHFAFLFDNTTIRAFINKSAGAGGGAAPGITVTLRRCIISAGFTSPPTGPSTCTTYTTEPPQNTTTDATGRFEFAGLQEGVWQITVNPATGGFTTASPATMLFQLRDAGDVEVPAAPIIVS